METAKVDIRKLQTLSDCINRTIEALNQVRLSVHAGNLPYAPIGLQATGAPFLGAYPGTFAIAPQIMGQVAGVIPGIAHSAQTSYLNQLAGVAPWANLAAQWPNAAQAAALGNTPYNQAWANSAWTNTALNGTTVAPFAQTGLAHTGVNQGLGINEYAYADPYATARIAQTFPFVHWGYSPFGWPTV
jgi:hypothetical protein